MRFSVGAIRFLVFVATVQMAFTIANLAIASSRFGETPAAIPFAIALFPSAALLLAMLLGGDD